ncbi:MAG: GGDEF domain-containing protein [Nitrospirae bacterium]|nr:GGDEF domain-containing protein [Nitrospirota bacterium]
MNHNGKIKVALIGAGQEGLEILSLMRKDPDLSVMMLVDPDKSALGFRLADYGYKYSDNLDLGFSQRFQTLSSIQNLSLIIDTAPEKYHKDIYSIYLRPAEIMNGSSARLVWELKSKSDMKDKRNLISGRLTAVLEDLKTGISEIPYAHALNEVSSLILRSALLGVHADSAQLTILSKDSGCKILKDICSGRDLLIKKGRINSPVSDDKKADRIIRSVVEKREVYKLDTGAVIPVTKDGDVIAMVWLYYTNDNINRAEDDISFVLPLVSLFGEYIQDAIKSEKSRLLNIEERLLTEPLNIIRSDKPAGQKLNDINRTLRNFVEAEDSHIYIKDPATGDIVLQATTLKFPFLTGEIRIRSGTGILSEILERRNLITLSEPGLSEGESISQFAKREDTVSIVYLPLVSKGDGVGVIAMEFTNVRNLTPKAISCLEDIGFQLAGSISNDVERHRMSRKILKLYTVNEEGIEILSTVDIEKIGTLATSSSAMLLDSEAAVLRLNENGGLVVKSTCGLKENSAGQTLIDIDNELCTTAMQTKIPVILHDLAEYAESGIILTSSGEFRYKTAMVIPVTYGTEVLGTLSFYNKTAPEVFSSLVFSDDDREIAERFIQYIARGIINARRYSENQSLITIDELTGLRNERYLQMRFPEELNRARRYNRSVSLIFLDVKPADETIIHYASRIVKETFRYIDVLVRLKEAKFAILLPDTGPSVKDAVVRIADGLGTLKEKKSDVSIYIGYSTYPYDNEDMHELIKKASKLRQY